MNTENMWIVILLLILIMGGANAGMYFALKGLAKKGDGFKWLPPQDQITPWKNKDNEMSELRKRMQELKENETHTQTKN